MNLLDKMLYNQPIGHAMHNSIVYKGGGQSQDSQQTSVSKVAVDAEYKPDVAAAMASLRSQYEDGSLGQVAGVSGLQQEAFDAASGSADTGLDAIRTAQGGYTDALEGTGRFSSTSTDDLERAAIDQAAKERGGMNDSFAASGAMGGSRQAIAAGSQDAQLTGALAKIKYDQLNKDRETAMWGADSLTQSGVTEAQTKTSNIQNLAELGDYQRGIDQEELDADAKGLESYITGIKSMQDLISTSTTKTQGTTKSKKSGK